MGCTNDASSALLDELAERYVKLVLEIGQYNDDFVDAYYGPAAWKKTEDLTAVQPPEQLNVELQSLHDALAGLDHSKLEKLEQKRLELLEKQVVAVGTKLQMMQGQSYSFDEEARLLYDAMPPHIDTSHFNELLADLDHLVPGEGSLSERYTRYSSEFVIPINRLDLVFQAAIAEARSRTQKYFALPDNESFTIEYVKDKAWSGYNYYKGNGYSLIQINTDFPIYIERAIDLGCHEGYPGHHVFNALIEKYLVVEKGWVEFSVYPLFSPASLIAEGSANYGIDMAFPGDEKTKFEREVLYPLAGLDPTKAEAYNAIQKLRSELNYAGNEAARLYLNGKITREVAAKMLEKYLLYEPDRALQRTRFFDQYRSYVINYNLGKDLVAEYIESKSDGLEEQRWFYFGELLTSPNSASMLAK